MSVDFLSILKNHYFLGVYGLSLLVSLVTYRKYFDTVLKYYPILIAYTFLNELLGYLIKNNPEFSFFQDLNDSNINEVIYNIYGIVLFTFFYIVYWKVVSKPKYKRLIFTAAGIAFISHLISIFFQNPMDTNLFYATAISSWMLILCILLYFKDKQISNQNIVQPRNLMFWVSLSLLVFYTIFPFLYLIGYLNYDIWRDYHLLTAVRILIILMHSILILGFLKSNRRAFQ